ncbi:hypothetical protein BKP35_09905 [Anaerobacillus arseniciselenatis]|uniref:Uncharacterized protein n=1 Tax=Anaerobacillus arseniciselenatis TaxID=85682 RepID=A0A1S2LLB0_9BACI|nr:hypothetical protein [Anaerobacillus arseniciselenatis]OIJ12873.1 hypothetical protein BKP35_09905 [Anaerobacillus arseniciselenatis]
MLTFEQKLAIIESYPELTRHDVSLNRVNFHFEESGSDKKNVVYHLHPNGNGFVYAGKLKVPKKDPKGMVNIRNFSEEDLRSLIERSIESLHPDAVSEEDEQSEEDAWLKIWVDKENHTLEIIKEDEMWNVYAGEQLDGTFPSYNEAKQYLLEEGFKPKR